MSRGVADVLTRHEPGRDAFHRVPIFSGEFRDAVECVPTGLDESSWEGLDRNLALPTHGSRERFSACEFIPSLSGSIAKR